MPPRRLAAPEGLSLHSVYLKHQNCNATSQQTRPIRQRDGRSAFMMTHLKSTSMIYIHSNHRKTIWGQQYNAVAPEFLRARLGPSAKGALGEREECGKWSLWPKPHGRAGTCGRQTVDTSLLKNSPMPKQHLFSAGTVRTCDSKNLPDFVCLRIPNRLLYPRYSRTPG